VGYFWTDFYCYAQSVQTMFQECRMSNIRVFGMPVNEKKIFANSPDLTLIRPQ